MPDSDLIDEIVKQLPDQLLNAGFDFNILKKMYQVYLQRGGQVDYPTFIRDYEASRDLRRVQN